ncbi:hypothetical protein NP233_g4700 [Leucocoprinus birnbaumii]|uniref:Uncharacterized protein n=1 Tax=Leucocoprinus birnbaumii TaxID=56174 RepID=A0AAD5VWW8_9AGAR|nr:hypothetical protein NP233_g4700 [Leucocoprinus birnbaumii]
MNKRGRVPNSPLNNSPVQSLQRAGGSRSDSIVPRPPQTDTSTVSRRQPVAPHPETPGSPFSGSTQTESRFNSQTRTSADPPRDTPGPKLYPVSPNSDQRTLLHDAQQISLHSVLSPRDEGDVLTSSQIAIRRTKQHLSACTRLAKDIGGLLELDNNAAYKRTLYQLLEKIHDERGCHYFEQTAEDLWRSIQPDLKAQFERISAKYLKESREGALMGLDRFVPEAASTETPTNQELTDADQAESEENLSYERRVPHFLNALEEAFSSSLYQAAPDSTRIVANLRHVLGEEIEQILLDQRAADLQAEAADRVAEDALFNFAVFQRCWLGLRKPLIRIAEEGERKIQKRKGVDGEDNVGEKDDTERCGEEEGEEEGVRKHKTERQRKAGKTQAVEEAEEERDNEGEQNRVDAKERNRVTEEEQVEEEDKENRSEEDTEEGEGSTTEGIGTEEQKKEGTARNLASSSHRHYSVREAYKPGYIHRLHSRRNWYKLAVTVLEIQEMLELRTFKGQRSELLKHANEILGNLVVDLSNNLSAPGVSLNLLDDEIADDITNQFFLGLFNKFKEVYLD